VRTHALPALKKEGMTVKECQEEQGLGRSRGGFSTKIHTVCDALGNPLRFVITGGQQNDCTQFSALIDGIKSDFVLADKGYDTDEIIRIVTESGAIAVIPLKKNRKMARPFDAEMYKERYKIECLFGFLKHLRRMFARFEKTKMRFEAFLHFAAALQWIK
jgi:transposase